MRPVEVYQRYGIMMYISICWCIRIHFQVWRKRPWKCHVKWRGRGAPGLFTTFLSDLYMHKDPHCQSSWCSSHCSFSQRLVPASPAIQVVLNTSFIQIHSCMVCKWWRQTPSCLHPNSSGLLVNASCWWGVLSAMAPSSPAGCSLPRPH